MTRLQRLLETRRWRRLRRKLRWWHWRSRRRTIGQPGPVSLRDVIDVVPPYAPANGWHDLGHTADGCRVLYNDARPNE